MYRSGRPVSQFGDDRWPDPGAAFALPPQMNAEIFDRAHATTARSELLWRLIGEAYGDD